MKIAVVTSIRAPYRTLQFEEICKNKNIDMTIYYTDDGKEDRDWEVRESSELREVYLKKIKIIDNIGTLNLGLIKLVKEADVIFLGGYEKITYILLSLICKMYKKKYVIIFDGISCNRLKVKENVFKKMIKSLVIKNSNAIWGNGTISRRYFNECFNYPLNKIYNQYLTIDGERIKKLGENRQFIRKELREKYMITQEEIVIQYSGRLVEVKNVKSIIEAISKIKNKNIVLLVTGDGILRKQLENRAKELGVKMIVTGFIDNQLKLFKHYFISDIFILASTYEPWGLVVNEAMYAELPILVSNICGCSLDLVDKNGYLIDPYDIDDIRNNIEKLLSQIKNGKIGERSLQIINEWNFSNSKKSFENIINNI